MSISQHVDSFYLCPYEVKDLLHCIPCLVCSCLVNTLIQAKRYQNPTLDDGGGMKEYPELIIVSLD